MEKINVPILNRGPEVESSIGILIILILVAGVIFAAYSGYNSVNKIYEENNNYLNQISEIQK